MRCPNEHAAICRDCDGYGSVECDHCSRESECETCDGSGRSKAHLTECEWCEVANARGRHSEFYLRADIAEIVCADALARIPAEAQRFIVELANRDAVTIAPAVVHENLVVFAVRPEHAGRVSAQCGEGKLFRTHKAATPDSVGIWFAIAIPKFDPKSIAEQVAEAVAGRPRHAAA